MVILATCISTVEKHTPPFLPTGCVEPQLPAASCDNPCQYGTTGRRCPTMHRSSRGARETPSGFLLTTPFHSSKASADLLWSQYSRKINCKRATLDVRTYLYRETHPKAGRVQETVSASDTKITLGS